MNEWMVAYMDKHYSQNAQNNCVAMMVVAWMVNLINFWKKLTLLISSSFLDSQKALTSRKLYEHSQGVVVEVDVTKDANRK